MTIRLPHRTSGSWKVFLLAIVWIGLGLVVAYRTFRFGYFYPYSDDWAVLPELTGYRPVSWAWLFSHHNEHFIPVPRIFWLLGFRLTAGSFPFMAFANSLALIASGLLLNVTIARARGRVAASDVLIPIAVLSFAHVGHFWMFQSMFVLATSGMIAALAAALWLPALSTESQPVWTVRTVLLVALVVACLSGAQGLVPVTVLSSFLLLEHGFLLLSRSNLRTRSHLLFGLALALIVALCLALIATTPEHKQGWETPGPAGLARTVGMMLVAPFGLEGLRFWPWTAAIPLALLAAWSWRTLAEIPAFRGVETSHLAARLRRLRPAAVVLSMLALFSALAIGRGGLSDFPIAHYGVLAIPLYFGLYAWGQQEGTRFVQRSTAALVVLVFLTGYSLNLGLGFEWGRSNRFSYFAFENSVLRGDSAESITDQHMGAVFFMDTPQFRKLVVDGLHILKASGIEPYVCVDARRDHLEAKPVPGLCQLD